jgi:hypothetical protein
MKPTCDACGRQSDSALLASCPHCGCLICMRCDLSSYKCPVCHDLGIPAEEDDG